MPQLHGFGRRETPKSEKDRSLLRANIATKGYFSFFGIGFPSPNSHRAKSARRHLCGQWVLRRWTPEGTWVFKTDSKRLSFVRRELLSLFSKLVGHTDIPVKIVWNKGSQWLAQSMWRNAKSPNNTQSVEFYGAVKIRKAERRASSLWTDLGWFSEYTVKCTWQSVSTNSNQNTTNPFAVVCIRKTRI